MHLSLTPQKLFLRSVPPYFIERSTVLPRMSLCLLRVSTNHRRLSTNPGKPSTDLGNLSLCHLRPSTDLLRMSLCHRKRSTDPLRPSTSPRKRSTDPLKMATDPLKTRLCLVTMTLPDGSQPLHRLTQRLCLESQRLPVEIKPLCHRITASSRSCKASLVDKKRKSLVAMGVSDGRTPHPTRLGPQVVTYRSLAKRVRRSGAAHGA